LAAFSARERVPSHPNHPNHPTDPVSQPAKQPDMWFVVFSHCPHCLPTATPTFLAEVGGRDSVYLPALAQLPCAPMNAFGPRAMTTTKEQHMLLFGQEICILASRQDKALTLDGKVFKAYLTGP